MKEDDKTVVTYPKNINSDITVPDYLIYKIEDHIYFIYREISKEETRNRKEYELLEHDNKHYLLLGSASSERKSMLAIESYWKAIEQLEKVI
jgi:hypothetical protein